MPVLKLRLFFLLISASLIFFPKLVFSDWGSETIPPTATVIINCGGTDYTATGNINCGATSATITFDFAKPVSSGATGLNTLNHKIEGGTAIEVTPTPTPIPTCDSSGSISTGVTTTCGGIPRIGSAIFSYTVSNATSLTVSATAKDHAGNSGDATTSGSSFTLNFVTYSISGAVYTDTDKNGIKNDSEQNYSGSISITRSPASGTLTTTGSTYSLTGLTQGTYIISHGPLPSGYSPTVPSTNSYSVNAGASGTNCNSYISPYQTPSGTSLNASCSNGSVQNLNFGINNSTTWFQGKGGDMRLDGRFTDKLPSSSTYASLPGAGGTPGIIFSNNVGNKTQDFGLGNPSNSPYNWYVGGSTYQPSQPNFIRTSYNYLSSLAAQSATTLTAIQCGSGGTGGCILSSLNNGVYKAENGLTMNATTFQADKDFVILVNGNLTISENIIVPNGSTAVFAASGDIKIDKTVGETTASSETSNIQGFFSAGKDFILEGYGGCGVGTDRRLNVQGALVANAGLSGGTFRNNRDLCGGASNPSLYIVERVDFILNAPAFIKRTPAVWREVPPGPGAPTPTPIPTATPTPAYRRVFITNQTYNGNLGGLDGADNTCTTLARTAGLGQATNWMAWLSDGTTDPASRFTTKSDVPYKLLDPNGTTIANNWADLIDNTTPLAAAINVDQNSNNQSSKPVWTNTGSNGTKYTTNDWGHCNGWTNDASSTGNIGNSNSTDSNWTRNTSPSQGRCDTSIKYLYCFEQ